MDKDGSRRSRVTRTPGENQCVRCHHLFEEPFSKFNVEVEPAYNRFPGTAVAHFFSHAYDETWRCAPPGTGRLGPRTIPRKLTSGIRVVSAEKARSRPCFVCFPAEQRDQYVHFPSKRPQFKAGPSGLQLLDAVESSTIDDLMLDPREHPVVSDGTQPPPPPLLPSPQHQQPSRSGSPLGGRSGPSNTDDSMGLDEESVPSQDGGECEAAMEDDDDRSGSNTQEIVLQPLLQPPPQTPPQLPLQLQQPEPRPALSLQARREDDDDLFGSNYDSEEEVPAEAGPQHQQPEPQPEPRPASQHTDDSEEVVNVWLDNEVLNDPKASAAEEAVADHAAPLLMQTKRDYELNPLTERDFTFLNEDRRLARQEPNQARSELSFDIKVADIPTVIGRGGSSHLGARLPGWKLQPEALKAEALEARVTGQWRNWTARLLLEKGVRCALPFFTQHYLAIYMHAPKKKRRRSKA